jgi:hypothetical protein
VSGTAQIKYEYNYLSDSTLATPGSPQTALQQYLLSFVQGVVNGYGSRDISIASGSAVPALHIPAGAAVFLQADNFSAASPNLYLGLNAVSAALTSYVPGQTPTRSNLALLCMGNAIISTPQEWNAPAQNSTDSPASIQLCVMSATSFGGTGPSSIVAQQGVTVTLATTLTGKVFWYY